MLYRDHAPVGKTAAITSAIDDELRIFAILFLEGDNPTGAFSINVLDPIGHPMPQGTYVTVEVTFSPAAGTFVCSSASRSR